MCLVYSRREPSALHRAQSISPSPKASPDQMSSRQRPPSTRVAQHDMAAQAGPHPATPIANAGRISTDALRISSHLIPLDESNYTDAVALKVSA